MVTTARCVRVASGPRTAGRALLAVAALWVAASALAGDQWAEGKPAIAEQAHAHATHPYAALHDAAGPEPDGLDWFWHWAARQLTAEQLHALTAIASTRRLALARIGWCESRLEEAAVGDHGESRGAWQVQPRFWGPVPATLLAQARQADGIAAVHGFGPWSTAAGCEGWPE